MSWNGIRNRGQVIKPASMLCSALTCRNIRERAPDQVLHRKGVAQSFAQSAILCGSSFRFAPIIIRHGPCKDTYFTYEQLLSTIQAAEFELHKLCATCSRPTWRCAWKRLSARGWIPCFGCRPPSRVAHTCRPLACMRLWVPAVPFPRYQFILIQLPRGRIHHKTMYAPPAIAPPQSPLFPGATPRL